MELFFRKYGDNKKTLIILHGLYGVSDNWAPHAKIFSKNYTVYALDQRNHGNSPHSNLHNYNAMADDLFEFMNAQNIKKAILLGHSMGGKTILNFAARHPEMAEKLVVVDISPLKYNVNVFSNQQITKHKNILSVFNDKNILKATTRTEAEQICSKYIEESHTRNFILKNLKRQKRTGFKWKINTKAIQENIEKILDEIRFKNNILNTPTLFIKAQNSSYITKKDITEISNTMPNYNIVTIKNAGHWVHVEQFNEFIEVTTFFLNS